MDSKVCPRCNVEKKFSDYHKSTKKKDGLQVNCKTCRKEVDHNSYLNSESRRLAIKTRRDANKKYNSSLINRYKRFCGCHFCSENEPVALDLHHLNPDEKDLNVSVAVSYSTKCLRKEVRKCVVLCANCHRKVHAGILKI